ncbi:MAG: T9SS type A sorting domain-containing protein [Bacteroidota bacterium]
MKAIIYAFRCLTLAVLILLSEKTISADYYWVGNSGNWSDYSHHWAKSSGGNVFYTHIPYPTDNVFFDNLSFTTGNQSVIIDQTIVTCNDMNWTYVMLYPNLNGPQTNTLQIFGSLKFTSRMTLGFQGVVSFEATSEGKTITSSGKIFNNRVEFNGVGGGWELLDELTVTDPLWLRNGTLTTDNHTVNVGWFWMSTSTYAVLNMGSSVFNVNSGMLSWDISGPGLTVNAGTSTINIFYNYPYFSGNGFTYHDVNFYDICQNLYDDNTFNNVVMHKDLVNIHGNNTFRNLTFFPGYTYTFKSGTTQTIIDSLNMIGNGSYPIRIQSNEAGNPSTFFKSSGVVCSDYILISDNIATGGAVFVAGTNSADLGRNSGWYFIDCGTVGISEAGIKQSDISFFPNPFDSFARISFSEEQKNTNIVIMDFTGRELKSIHFSGKQLYIDRGNLKPGTYLVQITDVNKKVVNKKITVQ